MKGGSDKEKTEAILALQLKHDELSLKLKEKSMSPVLGVVIKLTFGDYR